MQSETCNQIQRKENVSCVSTDDLSFIGALCRITKNNYWLRRVRPSVRLEQLGSHCTDFYES